jgi:hypothetical protein
MYLPGQQGETAAGRVVILIVILSEVEGSWSITFRWFNGIPRLRFAPLGMTNTESKRY